MTDAVVEAGLQRPLPLFGGISVLWPPVNIELTSPPTVLVRSPRDEIRRAGDTLLQPDLDLDEIERIEAQTDDEDTVSLVVAIGGLAAYPAIVLEDRSYGSVLRLAAHEWVHHYLAFYPLGEAWGRDDGDDAERDRGAHRGAGDRAARASAAPAGAASGARRAGAAARALPARLQRRDAPIAARRRRAAGGRARGRSGGVNGGATAAHRPPRHLHPQDQPGLLSPSTARTPASRSRRTRSAPRSSACGRRQATCTCSCRWVREVQTVAELDTLLTRLGVDPATVVVE